MNDKAKVPVTAVLATELALAALGCAAAFWIAQEIIVEALRFVLPATLG